MVYKEAFLNASQCSGSGVQYIATVRSIQQDYNTASETADRGRRKCAIRLVKKKEATTKPKNREHQNSFYSNINSENSITQYNVFI